MWASRDCDLRPLTVRRSDAVKMGGLHFARSSTGRWEVFLPMRKMVLLSDRLGPARLGDLAAVVSGRLIKLVAQLTEVHTKRGW